MIDVKLIKDPIYGYIKIPERYVGDIVDTAVFQRLRRIVQTSYSPLYPSSVHNRFAHAIGVYHLGKIAGDTLTAEIKKNDKIGNMKNWHDINDIFSISCLLHDVGHVPFSHTGEKFYKNDAQYKELHMVLTKLVDSSDFTSDVPCDDSKFAAPHEIMSAIIGVENFSGFFGDSFDREFFVRCITGYKFSNNGIEHSLYNCYISLLKSEVIDVDRLDYLIRDAYFTGFDTVKIDYERLLANITICTPYSDDTYELAYHKRAISVIENFVYSHDFERKWIQNHPSILYDMYLLQHIISKLDEKFKGELFSIDCLSVKGKRLNEFFTMTLLCDDDIISLMKSNCTDELSMEYFSRRNRKCPLWKTEAEYKAFCLGIVGSGDALTSFENALKETELYLRKNTDEWIINNATIERLQDDIKRLKSIDPSSLKGDTIKKQKESKEQILKVMECLSDYAESKGEPCDFVVLTAKQFYSGFNNKDFTKINILFPYERDEKGVKIKKFGDVVTSLSGNEKSGDDFFYIFYPRDAKGTYEKEEICRSLFRKLI